MILKYSYLVGLQQLVSDWWYQDNFIKLVKYKKTQIRISRLLMSRLLLFHFNIFLQFLFWFLLFQVTLRSDIKTHLTEGIYCILDLCKEQDIRFLKAGLHTGVREVFNELYSNYTHYHKTQRQGEDKYTVWYSKTSSIALKKEPMHFFYSPFC